MESGDFARAEAIVPTAGDLYLSALAWADEAASAVFAGPDRSQRAPGGEA